MACNLTEREREVLELLRKGMTSKQIADEIFTSKRTVDFHIANLYRKTGAGNRVQLVSMEA